MKRYNLCNISEDAVVKLDSYGDWVRYEDYIKNDESLKRQLDFWMNAYKVTVNAFEKENILMYKALDRISHFYEDDSESFTDDTPTGIAEDTLIEVTKLRKEFTMQDVWICPKCGSEQILGIDKFDWCGKNLTCNSCKECSYYQEWRIK